jgi:heme A synthase
MKSAITRSAITLAASLATGALTYAAHDDVGNVVALVGICAVVFATLSFAADTA